MLESKYTWGIHLIKAALADENWRRNKISAALPNLLLLLLDCFMEDMNLIYFQRQLGNSRQQRKGLPVEFAVFFLNALHLGEMQCHFLGRCWGEGRCVGTDPPFLSLRVIQEPQHLVTY